MKQEEFRCSLLAGCYVYTGQRQTADWDLSRLPAQIGWCTLQPDRSQHCDGSTVTSFHLTAAICKDWLLSQCFLCIMEITFMRVAWVTVWLCIYIIHIMYICPGKTIMYCWIGLGPNVVDLNSSVCYLIEVLYRSQPSNLPWCDPGKNCLIYRHHRVAGEQLRELRRKTERSQKDLKFIRSPILHSRHTHGISSWKSGRRPHIFI